MPNLGPFKHGVSWSDVPTSVIAPVQADEGLNVVFGSAPVHLNKDGLSYINKPRIYNRYEDAVAELGYSNDWTKYDICEHMDAVFVEFGVFPVVYVNVWDPTTGSTAIAPTQATLVGGQVDTLQELIAWTVAVKDSAGTVTFVEGTDYILSLSKNNTWVVTRIAGGAITTDTEVLTIEGMTPGNPETDVDSADIIGGIDISTGARTGLEVIEDVFQTTGKVPGTIICPKFSKDPMVAAAMEAKCENINGCFACTCLIDVDTAAVTKPQDVNAWKNANNLVFPRQQVLFGKPALVGTTATKVFNFASQQGPLMQWTDVYRGGGLPYHSPSNKSLRMNSLQREDGTELPMQLLDANMPTPGRGDGAQLDWGLAVVGEPDGLLPGQHGRKGYVYPGPSNVRLYREQHRFDDLAKGGRAGEPSANRRGREQLGSYGWTASRTARRYSERASSSDRTRTRRPKSSTAITCFTFISPSRRPPNGSTSASSIRCHTSRIYSRRQKNKPPLKTQRRT